MPALNKTPPLGTLRLMKISEQEIKNVAKLARLELSAAEVDDMGRVLSSVLAHFAEIESVPTEGVRPLVTPVATSANMALEKKSFFREDRVEANQFSEKILQNAPEKSGNLFKVPPVV